MVISTQLVFSTYLLNWNLKVSNETLPKIFKIRGRCVCMCVCVTKKKMHSGWSKRTNGNKLRKMSKVNIKNIKFPMRDTLDSRTEPQGKWQESITWVMLGKKKKKKTQLLFVFFSFWKLIFKRPISIFSFHHKKIEKGQNYMSDCSWWLKFQGETFQCWRVAQSFLSRERVLCQVLAWGLCSWLGSDPLCTSWKMRAHISDTWAVFK